MEVLVSILIQSLCLFVAAKLLRVQLSVISSTIVISVCKLISMVLLAAALSAILVLAIVLLCYVGLIKKFDSNCDFIKILGLMVVSIAAQKFLYEQIILPLLF